MGIREHLEAMQDQFEAELRDAPLPPPTEDDKATARLLAAHALHTFSTRTDEGVPGATSKMLHAWDEDDRLEGLTQLVVMKYAREQASPGDVAALRRWLKWTNEGTPNP
ncbi:hypothetical protein ACFZAR_43240 [Streptomyces sp. NPDC008222]|uniref:hypothetical protein n=1 Tax=Streptomyces sp. NPDC008222 TaxID=3364820 RepID=UPI0036E5FC9F